MATSLPYILFCLAAGILIIIWLTSKVHVHAFFALFIGCFIVGIGVHMPFDDIIMHIKDGFGNIMRSLGIIIVLGTTLGTLLEYTGSTKAMADFILRIVGEKHAAFAMSITGFIIGLPIFCDSGYIVLNGLNKSIAGKTGISIVVTSVSLASGLLSVHCLVPPHPGATAAAGTIGVDYGKLIAYGAIVAIPAMLIGYWWANFAGKKYRDIPVLIEDTGMSLTHQTSVIKSFLPVVIPILLIAVKSFLAIDNKAAGVGVNILSAAGEPVIALSVGMVLAFNCKRGWQRKILGKLLQEGAEKAGGILVIIGAGGAFGAILAATNMGSHLKEIPALNSLGLFFPFLVTFVLKTAQGSSTVAIITAASITLPLLPAIGLDTNNGRLICVLSMGAGSMMISHANDAYFWVIAKFSALEMRTMLRVYSVATIWMGLVTLTMIYLLSLILL